MTIQQEPPEAKIEKTVHQMDPRQAEDIMRNCLCASCQARVIAHYDWKTKTSTVACDTADCACPGFITIAWAERAKEASRAERLQAMITLRQAAPWLNPAQGKTEAQILTELGF